MTPRVPSEVGTLKDLLAKATPGPWELDSECDGPLVDSIIHSDVWVSGPEGAIFDENGCCSREDAALIVAAVNSLPALIECVEALKGLPDNCDGKEQLAFEAWAKGRGMNMSEHPLHYLFLDPATNAAREAWNECIRYCRARALAKLEGK